MFGQRNLTFLLLGIFFLNFVTSSDAAENQKCRHGWLPWKDSCFMFSSDTATWLKAEELCRVFGGHLVEIHNEEENNFVKDHLKAKHYNDHDIKYWMGLTDVANTGTWEWLASGSLLSYSDWYKSQPERNDEHCAAFYGSSAFEWHDLSCSRMEHFVCESSQV